MTSYSTLRKRLVYIAAYRDEQVDPLVVECSLNLVNDKGIWQIKLQCTTSSFFSVNRSPPMCIWFFSAWTWNDMVFLLLLLHGLIFSSVHDGGKLGSEEYTGVSFYNAAHSSFKRVDWWCGGEQRHHDNEPSKLMSVSNKQTHGLQVGCKSISTFNSWYLLS